MEPTEVAKHWEANAENWTRFSRAGHDVYRDALNTPAFLAMLPPVDGLSGLDIGCGEGTNTRQLARRGAHMNAIDFAPTFIHFAKGEEVRDPLGIAFQVADASALPFPDACFDFATAFMSLMDIANQARALTEAARVLRPSRISSVLDSASVLHTAPPSRRARFPGNDAGDRDCPVLRFFRALSR